MKKNTKGGYSIKTHGRSNRFVALLSTLVLEQRTDTSQIGARMTMFEKAVFVNNAVYMVSTGVDSLIRSVPW